jgi:hypothetical protein
MSHELKANSLKLQGNLTDIMMIERCAMTKKLNALTVSFYFAITVRVISMSSCQWDHLVDPAQIAKLYSDHDINRTSILLLFLYI